MPDSFVALDVETANADLASICQIGIVFFHDGEITESWSSLVNPEDFFDPVNVSIHGIDEHAVRGAPRFPEVAARLSMALQQAVVASHMPFDKVAVEKACDKHGISRVDCRWLDTARVCRRAWKEFARKGYGLANVAAQCGIEFRHHDAEEDARAAGLILVRAMSETGLGVDE